MKITKVEAIPVRQKGVVKEINDIKLLNGEWKFAPIHDQKPTNKIKGIEYALPILNKSDWETVPVPGVWEIYAEKYSLYEGVCWFYREFTLDNINEKTHTRIVFKGVNYKTDLYINGKFVGAHESGYTEFTYDISKFVEIGNNSVAVRIDNRPIIVKWPNDWGYGVYGGIHRDVFVEVYNDTYLTDIKVTPNYNVMNKKGILRVCGKLFADGKKEIKVKLGDNENVISCSNGNFSAVFEYDIKAWTPENPTLYELEISLDGKAYKNCKIGFRNIKCENKQLLLNGEKTQIKGTWLCF